VDAEEQLGKLVYSRLRKLLEQQGITQKELADHLHLSPALISRWVNGRGLPRVPDLVRIADYLKVSTEYLVGREQDERSTLVNYKELVNRLLSDDELEQIETRASDIWIATPDFVWDHDDERWRRTIFDNITKRGIRYYYLFRYTPYNETKRRNIIGNLQRELSSQWQKRVRYIGLRDDEFPWYAEHNLYNPFAGDEQHCILIWNIRRGDKFLSYNLELNSTMAISFAEWFQRVWNNKVDDPNWVIN
jgi:transcriptional regulator with XRE-family HTH domain